MTGRKDTARQGFALIAVLWVTAVLSAIAMSFATTARLQGQEALHGLNAAQGAYILQSALAKGEHELRKYRLNQHLLQQKEQLEAIGQQDLELWWPRYEPYYLRLEGRTVAVRLVADMGKLDVNTLDYAHWERLLRACGVEDPAEITAIANSVADWIDTDSEFRIGGAENDYYQGLDKPYMCKNGKLESIEELLLVKGITPELYNGTAERPGLVDVLDVTGGADKMDINSASLRAFLLAEGIPPDAVKALGAARRARPITRLADLAGILPADVMDAMREHFDIMPPGKVFIEAANVLRGGRLGATIRRTSSTS